MRVESCGPYDDARSLVANRKAAQIIFYSPLKEGRKDGTLPPIILWVLFPHHRIAGDPVKRLKV